MNLSELRVCCSGRPLRRRKRTSLVANLRKSRSKLSPPVGSTSSPHIHSQGGKELCENPHITDYILFINVYEIYIYILYIYIYSFALHVSVCLFSMLVLLSLCISTVFGIYICNLHPSCNHGGARRCGATFGNLRWPGHRLALAIPARQP